MRLGVKSNLVHVFLEKGYRNGSVRKKSGRFYCGGELRGIRGRENGAGFQNTGGGVREERTGVPFVIRVPVWGLGGCVAGIGCIGVFRDVQAVGYPFRRVRLELKDGWCV